MPSPRQASVHPPRRRPGTSTRTIAAASVRDHTGAIDRCGDTILTTRARRPDGVNTAGAVCIARGVPLSLESFIRHSAYDFGEPVIATVISSQAISRSTCRRRSIHQSAGCHPATMRTTICRTLTTSSWRWTCAHSWIRTRSRSSGSSVLTSDGRDGDHRRSPPEHRGARHRVRQDERGATPLEADATPVRQERLQVSGERTAANACTTDREDG